MEEKAVRKTTAKRVVRKSGSVKSPSIRTKTVGASALVSPARKAPTRATTGQRSSSNSGRKIKVVSIGLVLFAVLFGVSALIGLSDKGELDVAGVIAQRKERATGEEKEALNAVPAQQQSSVPNGGLVGMGAGETTAPPPVENTSSTTNENASTTEGDSLESSTTSQPQTDTSSEGVSPQESTEPQATEGASAEIAGV